MRELYGQLDMAIYDTVHDYRDPRTRARGSTALAPRCGMHPGTLNNKADPGIDTHKLGLVESVPVQLAADDYRILHAYAADLGHCAWQLPAATSASDVEVLDAYALVHERAGKKAAAIRAALADNRVTTAELAEIRHHFDAEVRAGLQLLSRLEALVS
jgi:hypothetical protein